MSTSSYKDIIEDYVRQIQGHGPFVITGIKARGNCDGSIHYELYLKKVVIVGKDMTPVTLEVDIMTVPGDLAVNISTDDDKPTDSNKLPPYGEMV